MKIKDELQKQLQMPEYEQNARDCIAIYNKLKELYDGHVWNNYWDVLAIRSFKGKYPDTKFIHRPSKIGEIFLKGLLIK